MNDFIDYMSLDPYLPYRIIMGQLTFSMVYAYSEDLYPDLVT